MKGPLRRLEDGGSYDTLIVKEENSHLQTSGAQSGGDS